MTSWSQVRLSIAYFAWGRLLILIDIYLSHFTLCIAQNASLHNLFRMGESDYLDDNLWCRSLSQTKRKIMFFLLFFFSSPRSYAPGPGSPATVLRPYELLYSSLAAYCCLLLIASFSFSMQLSPGTVANRSASWNYFEEKSDCCSAVTPAATLREAKTLPVYCSSLAQSISWTGTEQLNHPVPCFN